MEFNSIIISTVDREPEYIHRTLASLSLSNQKRNNIFLMVDGPNYKYYEDYKHYCAIYLNNPDSRMDTGYKRAAYNYARCLCLSAQLGGNNLILEDDVLFYPDWMDHLKKINIEEESWILSLNCIQNHGCKTDRGYEEFKVDDMQIPQPVWCGTFAVIYSPKILLGLPELMLKTLMENNISCYDMSIGALCLRAKIPIYECVPSLVKHIGRESCMDAGVQRNI